MSDATDAHLHRRLHERVRGLERLALGRMKALSVIAVLAGVLTPPLPLRTEAGDITVDLLGLATGRRTVAASSPSSPSSSSPWAAWRC